MATAFKKASIQGRSTPQEVADYRENAFRSVITRYFPYPHRVSKGNIVDVSGTESASIDCIIINPSHPYTIDAYDKFTIILADGVDVAIEVKPDISITSELQRGLKQVQSVKKLWRQKSPILSPSLSRSSEHVINESKKIPCFLFADKAKSNPMDTAKEINDYYVNNGIAVEEQVDFVVVNEVCIISNYKYPELSLVEDSQTKTALTGLFLENWAESTFAAFILRLNSVYHATATISSPILPRYLEQLKANSVQRVEP